MGALIKVVVPVSGGKDSQACLKLALENFPADSVLGLFCDTGWEHPTTYQHVDFIADYYGVKIKKISDGTVEDRIRKYKRFPSPLSRFCTSQLKVRPSKRFFIELAEAQKSGYQVWYGMRRGESVARSKKYEGIENAEKYKPNDINPEYPKYLFEKLWVSFVLPIVDWSEQDVFDYLGGKHNQLYEAGFDRVGCFPCLASTERKHAQAFNFDDFGRSQKQKIIMLEKEIGKKHEPANTSQMCMFCHI